MINVKLVCVGCKWEKISDIEKFRENTNKFSILELSKIYHRFICSKCDKREPEVYYEEKIVFESRNLKYCVVCNFPITKDRLDAFSETNMCSAKCVELQEEVSKKYAEAWPQPPDDKKICKKCGNHTVVRMNSKTGEYFIGCSQFPNCWSRSKFD